MKARPNITNANLRFKMAFEVNKGQNYWEDRFFFWWVNNQIINKILKYKRNNKVFEIIQIGKGSLFYKSFYFKLLIFQVD